MKRPGNLIYKCECCGAIDDRSVHSADVIEAFGYLTGRIHASKLRTNRYGDLRHWIDHPCGSVGSEVVTGGIARIVGYRLGPRSADSSLA